MPAASSRARLAISQEGVFGETPSTPIMQQMRFLKENFVGRNISEVSEEIRPDRMRSDLILTGIDAQGGFDIEFSCAFDQCLEALLCGTWDTTGDASFADGIITLTTNLASATA